MFCKYCGANIPAGSAVCPKCGRVLQARPKPAAGGVRAVIPFVLLIAILYVPVLWDLVRDLMFTPLLVRILLPVLGPVLGGVILCFGIRREKIDIASYRYSDALVLAAAGAMLLLSLLGIVFALPVATIFGDWPQARDIVNGICSGWSLFSWLWPAAVLLTFRRLDSGRIGPVGAALAFLVMPLGEVLMVLVLFVVLSLGPAGLGIAAGLSPVVSLLVTLLLSDKLAFRL